MGLSTRDIADGQVARPHRLYTITHDPSQCKTTSCRLTVTHYKIVSKNNYNTVATGRRTTDQQLVPLDNKRIVVPSTILQTNAPNHNTRGNRRCFTPDAVLRDTRTLPNAGTLPNAARLAITT